MAKGVFTTKIDPSYDDVPEDRYHFPRQYLQRVRQTVGDWIVYYEPYAGGGRATYFAVARVSAIEPHPVTTGHYYARISPNDFLEFPRPVPFREGAHFYERALDGGGGRPNPGGFINAVRNISDVEFDSILKAGFASIIGETPTSGPVSELLDPPAEFERPIIEQMVARPFRDQAFVEAVRSAYRQTCAVTGIKIINGGGRPEVQAAHIRPVAENGPDSVRNGLALSGTVHWMFDRGLITVSDDYRLRVATERVPEDVRRMFRQDGTLIVPDDPALRPHPTFLRHHQARFKG